MEDHNCIKNDTLTNIKEDVDLLKSEVKSLQQDNAETRVYVKQIFEKMEDLKILFRSSQENSIAIQDGITKANNEANKTWQPVVIELIKTISTIVAVLAGIKFMG